MWRCEIAAARSGVGSLREPGQKDVKNEDCSQDVVENKWHETTEFVMANIYMKTNGLSIKPIYT
jgi:hypothetical protein